MPKGRRRRSPAGKIFAGLAILLVILFVVFLISDRLAVGAAQKRLAQAVDDQISAAGLNPGTVDVRIDGFPFLTQVASGDFTGGTVHFSNLTAEQIRIDELDLVVKDVTMPTDILLGEQAHDVRAGSINGTASITTTEMARGLGVEGLVLSGGGEQLQVQLAVAVPIIGEVTLSGDVKPKLKGKRFSFEVSNLKAGGAQVPEQLVQGVSGALTSGFDLPLPFPINLDDVRVAGSQVLIDASATDVLLID